MSIDQISKTIGESPIFLMIGHGSKNQFLSVSKLKSTVQKVSKHIPENAFVIYFGDSPNIKKPDIGYAFQLLSELRPDIQFIMIQISEAKSWGVPSFVKKVVWHDDYPSKGECKWGGFTKSLRPCSNTKQWIRLHKTLPNGITKIFVLGGGPITEQEMLYGNKMGIPIEYYPMERRFMGDKTTRTKKSGSASDRYGPTYLKGRSFQFTMKNRNE